MADAHLSDKVSGAGGIRGLGALWSTADCCIMSEDTFGQHDQQLGVELMRMHCDPRGDLPWCPKWGVKSSSPAPAMQPGPRPSVAPRIPARDQGT
jgi:hypothetical protein